jgi:cyclophilin family peptidyl-prolyl cis-trans isomerase
MANANFVQGSQFFITETPQPNLNPCFTEGGCERPWGHVAKDTGYTIFGQCDDATVELVKKISRMPCQGGVTCTRDNYLLQNPVKITHIEIVKAGAPAKPSAGKPAPAAKPTPPLKSAPVAQ